MTSQLNKNYKKVSDLLYQNQKNLRAKPFFIFLFLAALNRIPKRILIAIGPFLNFLKFRCKFTIFNKDLYFYADFKNPEYPIRYAGGMSHELRISENILRLARDNSTLFDIGCSFGWYSVLLSDKCKKIVAFDPNDDSSLPNIKLNKVRNFTFHSYFLSDRSDSKRNTFAIDDLIKENMPLPDIVKMDVEGDELKVLSGAKELFAKNPPHLVLVETHSGNLFHDVLIYLESFGYKVYNLGCPKVNVGGDIYDNQYDLKTDTFTTKSEVRVILGLKYDAKTNK